MKVHESDLYVMRGSGVGSIFSNVFRKLIPLGVRFLKSDVGQNIIRAIKPEKVIKAAKRTAIDAGLDFAHDVLKGENVGKTLKKEFKKLGPDFIDNYNKGGKTSRLALLAAARRAVAARRKRTLAARRRVKRKKTPRKGRSPRGKATTARRRKTTTKKKKRTTTTTTTRRKKTTKRKTPGGRKQGGARRGDNLINMWL